EEKASQQAQLRRDMDSEEAQILSPEELAEYHLRQSSAAEELQQLYGVDFSEIEMRNMATALDDYHRRMDKQPDVESETLDQKLQTILGPARFAEFDRARSSSFRELYEVVSDFGQPAEAATAIFDLRLKSERQSDEIRSDKNRSPQEKQELLDEIQEQVEQAVRNKMGTGAYQSYKTGNGGWISALGRL
ncbi:MAG: hypothetical protein ACXWBP_03030, partial [Limisphaerales bacterium]